MWVMCKGDEEGECQKRLMNNPNPSLSSTSVRGLAVCVVEG